MEVFERNDIHLILSAAQVFIYFPHLYLPFFLHPSWCTIVLRPILAFVPSITEILITFNVERVHDSSNKESRILKAIFLD